MSGSETTTPTGSESNPTGNPTHSRDGSSTEGRSLSAEAWSSADLAMKLLECGLPNVAKIFEGRKISGSDLGRLDKQKLLDMGICKDALKKSDFLRKVVSPLKDPKVVLDSIHGHVELPPLVVAIIDTPQFQRLRYIKQMGAVSLVYPGAVHTRFEHSLGVCHLAGELTKSLKERQGFGINDEDILCLQIAGLCHDLGHGPFSHTFDQKFMKKIGDHPNWKHESASQKMFHHLVKDNNLEVVFNKYGLKETDIKFINELILGKTTNQQEGRGKDKSFLYEYNKASIDMAKITVEEYKLLQSKIARPKIVANKRNGIDVDKWDYIARDCHNLGFKQTFDHGRLINFARVIDVDGEKQICFKDKEASTIYEMFYARLTIYRRVCAHPVVISTEEMITEVLCLANDHLKIEGKDGYELKMSDSIEDMVAYAKLNDSILDRIYQDNRAELRPSWTLLDRLYKRDIYKCVGQSKPVSPTQKIKETDAIKRRIFQIATKKDKQVNEENIFISVFTLDYGMKSDNPVEEVRFYSKDNKDKAIDMGKEEVSQMLPNCFQERVLRVYSKDSDESVCLVLKKAYEEFEKNEGILDNTA